MKTYTDLRIAMRAGKRLLNRSLPIEEHTEQNKAGMRLVWCLGLSCVLLIGGCIVGNSAHANVTDEQAVRIIIGESANQGFNGMVAVGEVIRARNSVRGLYGLNNKNIDKQPAWVWKQAKKAWQASANSNITKGATHFENVRAFGKPSWTYKMIETVTIKDHIFYREMI